MRSGSVIRNLLPLITGLIFLAACGGERVIDAGAPGFGVSGALVTYKGKPFTGTMRSALPGLGQENLMRYADGLQHGKSEEIRNGKPIAIRRYVMGMKHGVHRTWYPDGKPRTYRKFNLGLQSGEERSWHHSGQLANYLKYDSQGKAILLKRWRRTGQVYMNVVLKDGQAFGMPGSKVCDPVEDE